ncbi:hypothetical protein [Bosea sp. 117]|uniref:hypothetical protein n=1 Tax=Bosea sp. 117 TaxID=1125973 RepID=UPI0004942E7A|nr:hypothetical protein [Bosea sp. 117]
MPQSDIVERAETGSGTSDAAGEAIAPEAVREVLARVLDADELRSSPQLSNILRFVVEATLDGRREAIKGYTIAVEALGRDPSFDPQADPIVRVEATRLRRALERYYAGAGANDEIVILVPRGSYVPQFRLRRDGLPPVEENGEGAVDPAVDSPPLPAPDRLPVLPPSAHAGRRVPPWLIVTALALLAVGLLAAGLFEGFGTAALRALVAGSALQPVERADRLGIPMIEVRPFEQTGASLHAASVGKAGGASADAGADTAEFDPLAIEVRVRDALARFDLLDVLATPDVRPASDCGAGTDRVFSAFSLGGLVENHEDGSVAVLLRLVDVCDGTIVWSREFESLKRSGDPTATEIALVRDIMAAIAEPYGIIQARARARIAAAGGGTATAGAYGCVLEAYGYWRSFIPAEHASARACLERAVAADSGFALGYALLAELYLDEVRNGVNPRTDTPALNRALAAAEQAVELAPTSAYARRALMDVHFFRGERGQAIAAGETALELNPYDVEVIADVGGRLITLGQVERGEAMLASVRQVAPGMPPWVDYHRVIAAYLKGDAPAASAAADHLMGEGYAPGLLARALASHLAGEDEAARADLRRLVELSPAWAEQTDAMVARFFPDPAIARRVHADLAAVGLPERRAASVATP